MASLTFAVPYTGTQKKTLSVAQLYLSKESKKAEYSHMNRKVTPSKNCGLIKCRIAKCE